MSSPLSQKPKLAGITLFAAVLATAVLVLPLILGQKITISPLLLIAVAIIPVVISYLIPAAPENRGRLLFSRVFYMQIAASVACAFLLLAIYRIAYSLGEARII